MSAREPRSERPLIEEPRVRDFLERAAPLFLDRRGLDTQAWESLSRLAESAGMTDAELARIVESLRERGVIAGERNAEEPDDATGDDDRRWWESVPEPAAPPIAAPLADAERARERWASMEDRKRVALFHDRARGIIVESRGVDTRAYAILADLAHSLGLSEAQFDEAMRSLGAPPRSERAPSSMAATRTEAATPSSPPAPPVAAPNEPQEVWQPADAYRRYLRLAIEHKRESRGYLSASAERKLVDEGARKLGLSRVFARHLLVEESAALDLPVLSARADKGSEPDDPRFEELVTRALPIVARERGMSARCHLILAAIARELGLDEQVVPQVVEMIQRGRETRRGAVKQRSERREAFVQDLRRSLGGLTSGAIAPPAHQQLIWRAEQLYGLATDDARSAIHDVAAGLKIQVVSLEQAARYVDAVVQERLGDSTRLRREDESEVLARCEQWGFTLEQGRQLIADCIESRKLGRIRERRIVKAALIGSGVAVTLFLGGFYAFVFRASIAAYWQDASHDRPPAGMEVERESDAAASPSIRSSDSKPTETARESWWTGDMEVLRIAARREMTDAEKSELAKLDENPSATRGAAYRALASIAARAGDSLRGRSALGELLAHCLVREPGAESRVDLSRALCERVAAPFAVDDEAGLDSGPQYAALRILLDATGRAGPERSAAWIGDLLESLGEPAIAAEAKDALERRAFAALLRRSLRELAAIAADRKPTAVLATLAKAERDSKNDLPDTDRRLLVADVLRAALPASGAGWRPYQPYVEDVLTRPDPLPIARLVDAFERTKDASLRDDLGRRLLAAVGKSSDDVSTDRPIPRVVRESLGLPATPSLTRAERVRIVTDRLEELLERDTTGAASERMIDETARLARAISLGLCLVHHDDRRFDELAGLDSVERPSASPTGSSGETAVPVATRYGNAAEIDRWVNGLSRSKQIHERMAFLDSLRLVLESVEDIHPETAERLADYLLSPRNETEHARRLERIAGLGKWTNLRIALAHAIGATRADRGQVAETLARIAPDVGEIPNETDGAARLRLWVLDGAIEAVERNRAPSSAREDEPSGPAALGRQLSEEWHAWLAIAGAPSESPSDANGSDALRKWIELSAARLRAKLTAAPSRVEQVDRLVRELAVIDPIADNDLERTVRLHQAWVALLAVEVDIEMGGGEGEVLAARESERAAENLLDQLWGSHRVAAKLIMVLAAKEKPS